MLNIEIQWSKYGSVLSICENLIVCGEHAVSYFFSKF